MSPILTDPAELIRLLGIPFSDQQLAAITAPLAPGVIIAGAGSGKTTVMAARVVWLVGAGVVRPDEVLGLTFTRKAAGELAARIRGALTRAGLLAPDGADELILTYDAFAGRIVNEHGLLLGIEPGARLITGAARYRLAARVVAEPPAPLRHLSRLRPDAVTRRVVDLAGDLRSHLIDPEEVLGHAERLLPALEAAPTYRGKMYADLVRARAVAEERLELARLVVRYEQLKQQHGYVEFADQMAWAAKLAADVPQVAQAARAEFGLVLLDEYQDTSAAQAQLLAGLFSGPDVDRGRGHPVTAVGDPCQAIYAWRGAAASNILRFGTEFPAADGAPAQFFALTVNRRSGQRILDAANELAAPIRADPVLAQAGLDLALACPVDTPPATISVAEFDTWPQEASWIADRVIAEHDSGSVPRWSEIAVLARRNAAVATLYSELVARGVPAEIVGLGGLLELPAIAEVVATLRLLADPGDNPALVRLLTSPRWAIGIADLGLLGRRAAQLSGRPQRPGDAPLEEALSALLAGQDPARAPSLLEAVLAPGDVEFSEAAKERFVAFAAEFVGLRRWASESVVDLAGRVIEVLGLEVELLAEGGDPGQLAAFLQAIVGYSDIDGEASLGGLLAWFDAEREYGVGLEQAVVSDDDSVKLLTVHRAKGLEWDVVFLPALAADVFPTDRVTNNWLRNAAVIPNPLRGDADAVPQVGELSNSGFKTFAADLTADQRRSEDRLAYVGVTRARRRLYGSSHAWDTTLARPRRRSDYLSILLGHATSAQAAEVSETNPLSLGEATTRWPVTDDSPHWRWRRESAELVSGLIGGQQPTEVTDLIGEQSPTELTDLDVQSEAADWQRWCDALVAQARHDANSRRQPVLPPYLSVTGVSRIAHDLPGYLAELVRPMPRLVGREQRAGTGFHRWIERRYSTQAALADDLEVELTEVDEGLRQAFLAGPYAQAVPIAVEVPFTTALAGRLVRGRIDAVFPGSDGYRFQVVDWKTGWTGRADPLQLAYYRLAWADLAGVAPAEVDAVFYEVPTGRIVRPETLPDRGTLQRYVAAAYQSH